jgi:hypothetical protein
VRRKMWSSHVSPRSRDNGAVARPSRQLSGRCSARLGAGARGQESDRTLLEGRVVDVCRSEAAQQYNHCLLTATVGNSQDGQALIGPRAVYGRAVVLLRFLLIY